MATRLTPLLLGALLLSVSCGRGDGGEDRSEASSPEPPKGPPSILLISIDTTRADHLGCYGRTPSPTPTLDRWAEEGVLFERALTPVPITLPAHATLLSGRLPHRHGVRDNGIYRLPPDVPTLAEQLRSAGYDTAAVVGSAVLDRQFGLDRGFRIYDDVTPVDGGLAIVERRAEEVTDAALAAARQLVPPYFLFVHYFDPHATYSPPRPFSERFRGEPYDGEIAYVDEQVGRLRRELQARAMLPDPVLVVTSDHGESLGQHGEATHGVFLYQSTVHVPLIVVAPGRWPAGRRLAALASLADVAPTLLELAGAPEPDGLDGRSLSGPLGGGTGAARVPLESEFGLNSYGWAPLSGLVAGELKWIRAPEPELYDLARDPGEVRNLLPSREADARRLATAWREAVSEDNRSRLDRSAPGPADAETLERLAALGYVAGSAAPRPSDVAALPDPKDGIGSLGLINEARDLMERGRISEARERLGRALRMSPRSVSGLTLLGSACILGADPGSAIEPLTQAARLSPAQADVQLNLGLALAGVGNAPGAEAAFRRALELAPRSYGAAVNLVDLLANTGQVEEAWSALQQARDQGLEGAAFDYLEGTLAAVRGDLDLARRMLERSLAGGLPPAAVGRARALLDRLDEASGSTPGA